MTHFLPLFPPACCGSLLPNPQHAVNWLIDWLFLLKLLAWQAHCPYCHDTFDVSPVLYISLLLFGISAQSFRLRLCDSWQACHFPRPFVALSLSVTISFHFLMHLREVWISFALRSCAFNVRFIHTLIQNWPRSQFSFSLVSCAARRTEAHLGSTLSPVNRSMRTVIWVLIYGVLSFSTGVWFVW